MKKFNSSRNIIIALTIIILVVLLISFTAMQRDNKKESLPGQSQVNGVVATIDNIVKAPFRGIENMVKSVNNLFNTYSENDELKKKIDHNASLQAEVEVLKSENEKLKKQLDLNETLINYDVVNASVVNRSPDSWQDVLIINKGKKDGIDVNMAVMGDKGLIGRVIIAEENSAKVELLTSINQTTNHFPVMIPGDKGDMVYGLMDGYNNKTHTLVVSQLTSTDKIEVGSKVTTSGLGNNSPKGLLVGEVKEVKKNKTGLTNEVLITPLADMYDVSQVTVVKRSAGNNE
ncbi:rod shape-determining protein MreC [Vagococcus sp. DIV0080]|uniref:Cell shape-determining protein MreC n=1 Tax=Candidatus Vagococcus giribetii TaxID=2230876 RepID=A0ABS3HSB0_9ENTE|nr:rod shape-determining protein MreC [Vagococcus sp. DIV0080]